MTETNQGQRFFGKYRGTVINNVDPNQLGRLLVEVPDVTGPAPATWAEACVPLAGPTGPALGVHLVPPIGAGVWVEFEQGDPQFPIWTGCRWGSSGDIPSVAKGGLPTSPNIVLQTLAQHYICISDLPGAGGITLKTTSGAQVVVSDIGITIDNGKGAKIELTGPTVSINSGALQVV